MTPEILSLFGPLAGYTSLLTFDFILFASLFAAVSFLFLAPGGLAWALSKSRLGSQQGSAIPGPSGLPLLGLVFTFTGSLTHRALAKLSESLKATQLMAFSIGFTRFIISSEPETAKEILSSSAFADRPVKESAYELLFHRAMGFAPFGEYWRNLRRISATYLFSPRRINAAGEFRAEAGLKMVNQVKNSMAVDGRVGIKSILHFGSLNNVMMTVFGKSYEFDQNRAESAQLESLVSEGYELLGIFNWSDHFPLLGWMDLQGVRKRCKALVDRVNVFVGKIIDDHKMKRMNDDGAVTDVESSGDFVDVLLDLENENKLSDSDMIAVLWEMIFRGTDTVAILLEWILARMVLHPDIQSKAQAEIDALNRPITDQDIQNLPYLQAIVKETLRMHPPGPLLSWARLAIHDTKLAGGHFIPAGTTAMVNMWAITHDEKVWADAAVFRPERFVEEEVSIMGSDLRLAPFGAGRRVCPGKALGLATVQLWLGQMLQNFKWMPVEDQAVDLSEVLKLSMEMEHPLVCKAVVRA
ncbi:cytochrome P450 78A5-like [Impatiens glandulifera]|uniref:cytochrome P450 78A5-like n=1 Tax=Impatiens glandulifera TaxID=253017 RepID=UPI001FB149AB|nr:cytochrome P450 78A5-like [Impatiens glandulifera]